jgi:hypothetical protein
LCRHFRIMTGCHQHVFILLNFKEVLFLHVAMLPQKPKPCKCTASPKSLCGF